MVGMDDKVAEAQITQIGDKGTEPPTRPGSTWSHTWKQLALAKYHDSGRWQTKPSSELAIDQLHTASADRDLLLPAPLLEPWPVLAGADQ